MNVTIDIKNIFGAVIVSSIITEDAISHEELMNSDYVQLSWNSDTGDTLPAGAYIMYGTEKYSLLEPYTPTRADEAEYQYTPQFQSRIMGWQKHPVPIYTYADDGTTVEAREFDWEFTGSPADAMYMVQQAIKNETGETWAVQLADSLPATISISSQSSSIFSVLNDIANQCKTEWWGDKTTNTLYLSQCKHGTAIPLSVGVNVKAPSVTPSKDGYFTRFYVFGSSRNVTQDISQGAATNSIINRRLTLDPASYPGGYIDAKPNMQQGEIFTTTLYYDNIYPSSKLAISDVRSRLKYRLDSNGNKIQTGADDEGNPVYEQYAIWYFQIADFSFDPETIIEGMNLSVSFETGQLASRDFELAYHEKAETVNDNSSDVVPFNIKAGDYEIILDESTGTIIPGLAYIIPQDGDQVILYNIEMPAEYTASARQELAETAQKDIAKRIADNNSYEFDSNPVDFYENSTDLTLGQAVTFSNGEMSLSTRVLMVEKHLDYPCQQRIRVGNEIIKGNTQQLREEVTQASQNIDILAAFNELSTSLQNTYGKYQREMAAWVARINGMWRFDPNDPTAIYSDYGVYSNSFISAKGKEDESGGTPTGATKLSELIDVSLSSPSDGQALVYDLATQKWVNKVIETGGIDEEELAAYLTSHNYAKKSDIPSLDGYATEAWVTGKNYATVSDLDSRIDALVNGAPAAFDTLKEIADVLQGNVDSIGDIITTLGTKADKSVTISAGTGLTGGGNLSANRTISLATVGTAGTCTKVTVDAYGRVTGHASLAATDIPPLDWSKITSGKPTTLAGYGITDGVNDVSVTGSGNVVSAAFISGHTLTLTKGVTAVATSRTVTAGSGLTGGGALSANITLNIVSANAGITVNADNIQLNTINVLTSTDTVKPLSAAQGKVIWDFITDLFEKVNIGTSSAPVWAIRAKYGLYTESFLSAKGANPDSGGTVVGVTALSELTDVSITPETLSNNDMLRWNGSKWVAVAMADITPDLSGYATQAWVTSQKYLTTVSIATITDLHSSWDAVLKAQKPAWLTTVSLATISDLHASWDALLKAAPTAYVTRWPAWSEVTSKPTWIGANKPSYAFSEITGKPTTLSGYGITDAYTKVESSNNYLYKTIYNPTTAGVLAKTNIPATSDAMVTVIISGNPYNGGSRALYSVLHFYNYHTGNAILSVTLQNFGVNFGSVKIFTYDGYVCLWLPHLHNFMSYSLFAYSTNLITNGNRITSLTSAAVPSTAMRLVTKSPSNTALTSDNVASATKLQTARTINGTSFDGTANITTSKWGTARTLTLTGAVTGSVSIDGSGNVSLATTYATGNISALDSRYVNVSGDTMTGTLTISTADLGTQLIINRNNATSLPAITYKNTTGILGRIGVGGSGNGNSAGQPCFSPGSSTILYPLLHTGNYTSTLDTRYVKKAGDTMTGNLTLKPLGGPWLNGKTQAPIMTNGASSTTGSTYHPIIWGKTDAGDVWNLGHGASDQVGFFGFYSERTTNGTDWSTYIKVSTGVFYQSKDMNVTGLITATAGLTTPQYIQIGSGRIKWDSSNNALYVEKSDGTAIGFYSKGWVSAKGANDDSGTGGGGSSYSRLDSWDDYDSSKSGWVLSALLGNDLNTRIESLEAGSALSLTTTGSGNVVTAVSKSGTTLTVTKGITAALSTGTNASGTWPISVTGQAGRLSSTYTGGGGNQPPSYFNNMGLKVNMMSVPVQYSDVIVVNGYNGGGADVPYINAIAFQKTANAHGEVYHARANYGASSWGTWYKFLDEYNYAGTLDSRYVTLSTAQTISGEKTFGAPVHITGAESDNIETVRNLNGSITTNRITTSSSIRNALSFKWYQSDWQIGNIRSGSTNSEGFGITKDNSNLVFRVNETNGWLNGHPILHSANYTAYTVTKTGGGAYGTWNINILGYAQYSHGGSVDCHRMFTKNDNSGYDTFLLIADCSSLYTDSTNHGQYGFVGDVIVTRYSGYVIANTGFVSARIGYSTESLQIYSTTRNVKPYIVKYNGKYYIAFRLYGSSFNAYLRGLFYNALSTFTQLNCPSSSALPDGLTIVTNPQTYQLDARVYYADQLSTARQINGTNFDGSSNITTAKWGNARTLTLGSYLSGSVSIDGSANVTLNANVLGLTSQGNKTAISGTTMPASGLRMYQVYNNGYPCAYGNLISVKGLGAGELLLEWTGSSTLGHLRYRSKRDSSANGWSSWGTVAFTTDNVASASKWATARTITLTGAVTGSVSIDGSGNVSLATTYATGNISALDSRYVNISGDTMTGTLTVSTTGSGSYNQGIRINRTALNQWATLTIGYVGTATAGSSANTWLIGTPSSSNSLIFNLNTANESVGLCLKGHGNTDMKWNNQTVWHAGNDGSGSGLDADLLDGTHKTGLLTSVTSSSTTNLSVTVGGTTKSVADLYATYLDGVTLAGLRSVGYAMQMTTIDASSLNVNTWYPVTINTGPNSQVLIAVIVSLDSGTKPSWSTHQNGFSVRKVWYTNGSGWGTNPVNRMVLFSDYSFTSTDPVRGLNQLTYSNNEYVYVRGGGKYYFYISHGKTPVLHTSTYTVNEQSVSPTTTAPAAISRTNAMVTDNVASATKLQTARTIWGQPFDGTAPVSGDMTEVGNISFNGGKKLYWKESGYGDQFAIVPAFSGTNDSNILQFQSATGDSGTTPALTTKMVIAGQSGNVGIGTTSPSYKLHVAGTGYFSGATSFGSAITAASYIYTNTGWFQNNTAGAGLYNKAANARWYANANGWVTDKPIVPAGNNAQSVGTSSLRFNIGYFTNVNTNGLAVNGTATLGAAVQVPYSGSSWISMATRTNLIYSTTNNSTSAAHALYRVKAYNGNALCFGGLGNNLGFYAFTAANISSSTNVVWGNTYWDMTNWTLHHGGVLHCTGGIYSDSYVSAKGNNSSSDIRLKNILCNIHPSLKDFAKAPLFKFAWKSNPGMVEIGSSAQYWRNVLPDTVKERDGWLEMGYGNIALAGVITIARDFETLEQRVDRLEKENGKLKKRIKELERRAA